VAKAGKAVRLPRQIVFDTTNATYFANVKRTLGLHGWKVLDRILSDSSAVGAKLDVRSLLPRLLYFANSQDTVNELRSLVAAGETDPSLACTLLDSHEGATVIVTSATLKATYICSAELCVLSSLLSSSLLSSLLTSTCAAGTTSSSPRCAAASAKGSSSQRYRASWTGGLAPCARHNNKGRTHKTGQVRYRYCCRGFNTCRPWRSS